MPASRKRFLGGPFGEADLEAEQLGKEPGRCTFPPEADPAHEEASFASLRDTAPGAHRPAEPDRESSIRELLEAPEPYGTQRATAPEPGSIEEALLRAAESQPRREPASRRRPKA